MHTRSAVASQPHLGGMKALHHGSCAANASALLQALIVSGCVGRRVKSMMCFLQNLCPPARLFCAIKAPLPLVSHETMQCSDGGGTWPGSSSSAGLRARIRPCGAVTDSAIRTSLHAKGETGASVLNKLLIEAFCQGLHNACACIERFEIPTLTSHANMLFEHMLLPPHQTHCCNVLIIKQSATAMVTEDLTDPRVQETPKYRDRPTSYRGACFVCGDNIDTDQIIPAEYLTLVPTKVRSAHACGFELVRWQAMHAVLPDFKAE